MNSMTQDDTYNGYANRETWAFNLHWQNDRGLYNETLEAGRAFVSEYAETNDGESVPDWTLGDFIVSHWRDFIDELDNPSDGLRTFEREVGSWWRIDYAEVGAAVRESLDNES